MSKQKRLALLLGVAVVISVFISACGGTSGNNGGGTSTPTATCPSVSGLTGAGSTFDNPLFSQMFAPSNYPTTKCGTNVNYQSVGSGAGINQLLSHTVDFGATDSPMTDTQLAQSTGGLIIHIPVTLGAEAISYNLTAIPSTTHLQFTGPVIAQIYLGKITFWDDAAIKALNPGVSLPHETISVVHRSDGSGTTSIFTHYLSAISPDWSSKVGAGTTVNWPVGVGGKGNAGVAAAVKSTAGAIGYLELAYVLSNNITYGVVQNAAGNYVAPSLDGAKEDAANVTTIPADLRFFIVNAPGANSYPISGFSWVIVYQHQSNATKGEAIANLLWWMTHEGQQYSTPLSYVPLPAAIVTKDEAQIKSMTCGSNNAPCYTGIVS
ncbi:MAG TPA: phosphate ABC transporter substrate-binding protein PstS [Ktedonobacteraceae bacterium]|nr:phosphate ABC transporter substrate-binding protein PstS [Ktedonobacteraceae bacterium]